MLPGAVLPVADSPAAEGTIQGALVLFKIPATDLENRPLELLPDSVACLARRRRSISTRVSE